MRPDGNRFYTDDYYLYCQRVVNSCPVDMRSARKRGFVAVSHYESRMEVDNNLPNEHLIGICEVYTDCLQAARVARYESQRLSEFIANPDLLDDADGVIKDHLQLVIVTNVSSLGVHNTDLAKQVVREGRTHCNCLLCVPAVTQDLYGEVTQTEKCRAVLFRHLNEKIINTYLPFARTRSLESLRSQFSVKEE